MQKKYLLLILFAIFAGVDTAWASPNEVGSKAKYVQNIPNSNPLPWGMETNDCIHFTHQSNHKSRLQKIRSAKPKAKVKIIEQKSCDTNKVALPISVPLQSKVVNSNPPVQSKPDSLGFIFLNLNNTAAQIIEQKNYDLNKLASPTNLPLQPKAVNANSTVKIKSKKLGLVFFNFNDVFGFQESDSILVDLNTSLNAKVSGQVGALLKPWENKKWYFGLETGVNSLFKGTMWGADAFAQFNFQMFVIEDTNGGIQNGMHIDLYGSLGAGMLLVSKCIFYHTIDEKLLDIDVDIDNSSVVSTIQPQGVVKVGISMHHPKYQGCSYFIEWQRYIYKLPILPYNKDTILQDVVALGIMFKVHLN